MRWMVAAIVCAGAAMLASCETGPAMEPAQCAVADWRQIGFQDGSNGRAPERFVERQQACIAAGYGADQQAYMAGRREGLWNWCRPDRAFQLGLAGNGYSGQCPPELDGAFRDAHADGSRAYQALSALRSAESSVSSLRGDLDSIEHKIDANEAGLIASKTDEERTRHRNELIRLRDERSRTNERLRDAERDSRDANRFVQQLRGELGFRYGSW